tara:strand:+ start:468 stop:587 length:120 start_codon:yes stop_codon:yes gene_type:complete
MATVESGHAANPTASYPPWRGIDNDDRQYFALMRRPSAW